jgi:hypothetical protein
MTGQRARAGWLPCGVTANRLNTSASPMKRSCGETGMTPARPIARIVWRNHPLMPLSGQQTVPSGLMQGGRCCVG